MQMNYRLLCIAILPRKIQAYVWDCQFYATGLVPRIAALRHWLVSFVWVRRAASAPYFSTSFSMLRTGQHSSYCFKTGHFSSICNTRQHEGKQGSFAHTLSQIPLMAVAFCRR